MAETAVKRLLCCGFRHNGKAIGQAYQCWWRICWRINVLSGFEYHMFYVLYLFVTYLLTLPRTFRTSFLNDLASRVGGWNVNDYFLRGSSKYSLSLKLIYIQTIHFGTGAAVLLGGQMGIFRCVCGPRKSRKDVMKLKISLISHEFVTLVNIGKS
jgi:hypothetical protein